MSAPDSIRQITRHWTVAAVLLGVLLLLLALLVLDVGRRPAALPVLRATNETVTPVPVASAEKVFSLAEFAGLHPAAPEKQPFYTKFFAPPPPPPKPVPPPVAVPPAPVMKKYHIVYQGLYEGADGRKKAFLTVDTNSVVLVAGEMVAGDWGVSEIALRTLALTNAAGKIEVMHFNQPGTVEVKVK